MFYQRWAEEMAPIVQAILSGKQGTPPFPGAEAWLAYILCLTDSSLCREEIEEKSNSLNIQVPPTTEVEWAFERLKARGWLRVSYAIDTTKTRGWDGDWIYGITSSARRVLNRVMGDMSNHRDAQKKLENWFSTHPPDSPSEEVVLAYALYLNESTLSLASVIEEIDAVDKGFPNGWLLGAAFLRLLKRGWLVIENGNTYGLTPEAREFMDTIVEERIYFGGPDEHLGDWMFTNPPPGYEQPEEGYHEQYTFPEG